MLIVLSKSFEHTQPNCSVILHVINCRKFIKTFLEARPVNELPEINILCRISSCLLLNNSDLVARCQVDPVRYTSQEYDLKSDSSSPFWKWGAKHKHLHTTIQSYKGLRCCFLCICMVPCHSCWSALAITAPASHWQSERLLIPQSPRDSLTDCLMCLCGAHSFIVFVDWFLDSDSACTRPDSAVMSR